MCSKVVSRQVGDFWFNCIFLSPLILFQGINLQKCHRKKIIVFTASLWELKIRYKYTTHLRKSSGNKRFQIFFFLEFFLTQQKGKLFPLHWNHNVYGTLHSQFVWKVLPKYFFKFENKIIFINFDSYLVVHQTFQLVISCLGATDFYGQKIVTF